MGAVSCPFASAISRRKSLRRSLCFVILVYSVKAVRIFHDGVAWGNLVLGMTYNDLGLGG